jgi:iron complex transport system substrate-binding protein
MTFPGKGHKPERQPLKIPGTPRGVVGLFIESLPLDWSEGFIFLRRKVKNKIRIILATCLVSALFLTLPASCQPNRTLTTTTTTTVTETSTQAITTTENEPIQITDKLGRTETVKANPRRIISLSPSCTEVLYALGLGDRLIADTTYCDYPPEAKDKPKIGDYATPNIEQIVALNPDLVLADAIQHAAEIIPQLESFGITVVGISPVNFDEIFENIRTIAKITGSEEKSSEILSGLQSRIKIVTDKTSALPQEQVLSVFYLVWHDPLMTWGKDTLVNDLIKLAGGKNIFEDISGLANIELEALAERNPQVMIAATGMDPEEGTLKFVNTEVRLAVTDAVKNQRIYGVNVDISGRTGPRIVDGLEEFARAIHPELFK